MALDWWVFDLKATPNLESRRPEVLEVEVPESSITDEFRIKV